MSQMAFLERRGPGGRYVAQASAIPGLLQGVCAASKALSDVVDSGRHELPDAAHLNNIASTLLVLELQSEPISVPGAARTALFLALLRCINATLRWPAGQTVDEIQTENAAKSLCAIANRRAREMFRFGAAGEDPSQRSEAVAFVYALLESNALQSYVQRMAETTTAALDGLRHQQQEQQQRQQGDRPMGQAGAAARNSNSGAGSSSSNTGTAPSSCSSSSTGIRGVGSDGSEAAGTPTPQTALQEHRSRLERWLPLFMELGQTLFVVAQHDPWVGVGGHVSSGSRRAVAQRGMASLAPPRAPPARKLFADAMAGTRATEHAARAMAALALLKTATREQQQQQQQQQHSPSHAGGGAAGGLDSSWAIESCAAFLQHLGSESDESAPSPAGISSSSSSPASPRPLFPESSPLGPWSRYLLTCLGLRCLHDLDGGSCYGMPRELVAGLPHMVAPGGASRKQPNVDEFTRVSFGPLQATTGRIQTLACMAELVWNALTPWGRGRGSPGGPSGGEAEAREGCGAGGMEGDWPVVGPRAARDIARRLVGWVVGVARGWAADEERRAREGGDGGGARRPAAGGVRQGSLGAEAQDLTWLGHETVAVLAVQAVKLDFLAQGCDCGDGGSRAGAGVEVARAGVKQQQRQQWEEAEELKEDEKEEEGEQQQELLLLAAEWYGLACSAASHALRWTVREDLRADLAGLMALRLPNIRDLDHLPPRPPLQLAGALDGGYLPCLDTLLRRCGHYGRGAAKGDVSMLHQLLLSDPPDSGGGSNTNGSGIALEYPHDLPWLLAYGEPRQSASLLASMAKLLRRAVDGGGGGDGGGASCIPAADSSSRTTEGACSLVDALACMLCSSLGPAFAWMQDAPRVQPYNRAGGADAGGGSGGAGPDAAAARFPAGPARLQLLLSFALARLVPPLSVLTARRCRQLLLLLSGRGAERRRGRAGGAMTEGKEAEAARHRGAVTCSLVPLLTMMVFAVRAAWRCKELARQEQGAAAGPSSSNSSRGSPYAAAGATVVAAASASGVAGEEGTAAAVPAGPGAGAGLLAAAEGLQQLLDGEADMAGLVGAALDCLQLLPACDRGQVAATVLMLIMFSLRSCAPDMTPPGNAVSWSAASPTVRQVVESRQPEKLRAATAAARAAGFEAAAKDGDTLVSIAEGYVAGRTYPGDMLREYCGPDSPLWLLGPGEVGRELGGSCCCNARCTRLEGDSEAGEGQGQGQGRGQGLLVCGRCGGAWYCCRECQAADWAAGHKRACRRQ